MDRNEYIVKLLEEIRDNQNERLKIYKETMGKYSRLTKKLIIALLILLPLIVILKLLPFVVAVFI